MKYFKFELQRFAETSQLGILETLGKIITTLDLNKLAEDLNNAKNATEWLKNNANPILNFIGKKTPLGDKFGNYAKLITGSISIIDNALAILKGNLSDAERAQKFGLISSSLESMAVATEELIKSKKLTSKSSNLWFMSIVSAGISLVANLVAGSDGIEPKEKEAINRSYITFMRTLGTDLAKKIFNAATDAQFNKLLTENVMEEAIANGKFFQNASKTFTKAFGIVMTFGAGILNGVDKYKLSMEKYTADGIPEKIAKHDAFIDALAKFIKETLSGIVVGLDDVIFSGSKWILSLFGINYAEDGRDYVEVLTDYLKNLNYKNSGTRNDDKVIYVLEDNSMVYGNDGDDYIGNYGFSNVTIWGGHDDDTLGSYKTDSATPQKNSIFGGPGDDQISVYDIDSTIYGGTGKDFINVVGTSNEILGDEDDDKLYLANDANDNTISGGTGDDFVVMLDEAKNTLIKYSTGDGNDTIYGFNEDDALKISGSYDTSIIGADVKITVDNGSILLIGAAGKNIKINDKNIKVGEENSSIEPVPPPEFPTLPATVASPIIRYSNNDNIILNDRNHNDVIIQALEGNDEIYNGSIWGLDNYYGGLNVTINGGAGNDAVYNYYGDNASISGGAGNDSIKNGGYWYDDTRNRFWHNGGTNITIDGDTGDDSIFNDTNASLTAISGGPGNDYIYNYGDWSTIDGGEGNDGISNGGKRSMLTGGEGDDTIGNDGESVTINAGEGNDYISNLLAGHYASISGGEGNDSIYNNASVATINGGADNDEICLDNSSAHYSSKNIVIAYNDGDGNDTISGFDRNDTLSISGGSYFTTKSGDDIIVTVGEGLISLVGAAYLNALNIIGTLAENEDATDDTIDDTADDTADDDTADDTKDDFADDTTDDTVGDMTDDAVDDTADDTVGDITDDAVDDTTDDTADDDTNGISDDTADDTVDDMADDAIDDTADDTDDDIADDTVDDTADDDNEEDKIFIIDRKTNSSVTLDADKKIADASKLIKPIRITGNTLANSLFGGKGNDTLDGTDGNNTLTGGKGKDVFIYSGGDGIITDYETKDKISVASAYESFFVNGKDVIFNFGDGNSLTIKDGAGKAINMNSGVNYYTADGVIDKRRKAIVLNPETEEFTADSKLVTIDGSATEEIEIIGNKKANFITAGDNDSTLTGGKGKDTLIGGYGTDVFVYNKGDGKDVIENYGYDDVINLGKNVTIKDAKIKNGNAVFKVKGGSITVNDSTDVTLTADGKETIFSNGIFIDDDSVKVLGSFKGTVDLQDYWVTTADASLAKNKIMINGTDWADSLVGGKGKDSLNGGADDDILEGGKGKDILKGDAGDDSLWGGKGNDTLYGGEGDDTFLYKVGEGTDVIADYANGDMLQILDKKGREGSFKKATFKGNDLTLTINGGGKVIFSGVNTSTSFNINGKTYTF
ncbi:MAG: hypothetical protein IKT98_07120 [Selenomonadaceae bacterium]|nr:hypothetical protein [Selenomonadaceae bacterium]